MMHSRHSSYYVQLVILDWRLQAMNNTRYIFGHHAASTVTSITDYNASNGAFLSLINML